jgi:hypothetical protein
MQALPTMVEKASAEFRAQIETTTAANVQKMIASLGPPPPTPEEMQRYAQDMKDGKTPMPNNAVAPSDGRKDMITGTRPQLAPVRSSRRKPRALANRQKPDHNHGAVEFRTAAGEVLTISITRTEAARPRRIRKSVGPTPAMQAKRLAPLQNLRPNFNVA